MQGFLDLPALNQGKYEEEKKKSVENWGAELELYSCEKLIRAQQQIPEPHIRRSSHYPSSSGKFRSVTPKVYNASALSISGGTRKNKSSFVHNYAT